MADSIGVTSYFVSRRACFRGGRDDRLLTESREDIKMEIVTLIEANSSYNQRQYQRRIASIDAYDSSQMSLKKLINNLDALLGCLEKMSGEWYDSFMSEWTVLEEVYAVALDRNGGRLENDDIPQIASAVNGIRIMVEDAALSCADALEVA